MKYYEIKIQARYEPYNNVIDHYPKTITFTKIKADSWENITAVLGDIIFSRLDDVNPI